MSYRCVTQNGIDGEVICIGNDENQGGGDYNGIGAWCTFTFEQIPELTEDLKGYIEANPMILKSLLKVVDSQVICKLLSEVQ